MKFDAYLIFTMNVFTEPMCNQFVKICFGMSRNHINCYLYYSIKIFPVSISIFWASFHSFIFKTYLQLESCFQNLGFFLNANNELWVTVKISYVLVLVGFWQGAAASVFPKVLFDNNVTIKEAINATTIISVYSVSIDFWKRKARVDSNLNHIHCQIIG